MVTSKPPAASRRAFLERATTLALATTLPGGVMRAAPPANDGPRCTSSASRGLEPVRSAAAKRLARAHR
ncbi:MAG: hypothetical protein WCA12_14535, partial [Burkholderiales bacterium]